MEDLIPIEISIEEIYYICIDPDSLWSLKHSAFITIFSGFLKKYVIYVSHQLAKSSSLQC